MVMVNTSHYTIEPEKLQNLLYHEAEGLPDSSMGKRIVFFYICDPLTGSSYCSI